MSDQFENLSIARRQLVRQMAEIGYGRIDHLRIVNGEPIFTSESRVTYELLIGREKEIAKFPSAGTVLKARVVDLFAHLTRIRSSEDACLEVRDGLPFKLSVAVEKRGIVEQVPDAGAGLR